jgi:hypothetical protein
MYGVLREHFLLSRPRRCVMEVNSFLAALNIRSYLVEHTAGSSGGRDSSRYIPHRRSAPKFQPHLNALVRATPTDIESKHQEASIMLVSMGVNEQDNSRGRLEGRKLVRLIQQIWITQANSPGDSHRECEDQRDQELTFFPLSYIYKPRLEPAFSTHHVRHCCSERISTSLS